MTSQWTIYADINFTRGSPVSGPGYRPHIVVEGDDDYKGVEFLLPLAIGDNSFVPFRPLYPNEIDYMPLLKRRVKFSIKEGARTVGTGVVTAIRDQFCKQ